MHPLKEKIANLLVLVILALAAWLRLTTYGDLRLSIGTSDTTGYVSAAQTPLLSKEIFTGRRLFTTNLLYKLASDESKCPAPKISTPGNGQENARTLKDCFDSIALIQVIFSILGWSALAWVISRHLHSSLYKILAATLIVGFAYSPQIAEWDGVLSPESLSLSVFALLIAFALEISFALAHGRAQISPRKYKSLILIWLAIFFLWVFLRDVHIYAIPIAIAVSLPLLLNKNVRTVPFLLPALAILSGLFFLGTITAHQSPRWQPSISHAFDKYILTSPSAMEFMTTRGMPAPEAGDPYETWFNAHADRSYALFLIAHPGFIVTNIIESRAQFASDFYQPYYPAIESEVRQKLVLLGELLHPETNAIYVLDILLLIGILGSTIKRRDAESGIWAWFATWIFLYASVSLFISFFGDTFGTRRHIFPSVEILRLYAWIFMVVLMDLAREAQQIQNSTQPE